MNRIDRELYEPIGGYPDAQKANAKPSSNTSAYKASETGAVREGLGIPYTRHLPLEALAAAAASFEYGAQIYAYRDWETDRKSTRLNSSHLKLSRMPSSA